ncbi:BatD family protein [Psychroflexus montanilacus]|uniref:BatD family protein n=1 Tax=Psychroflexus montanilacus TaxID=2873598 RepID=UPI001CCB1E0E|nr:BatD family protein [Psychroflexus montanilacus]MBZ9652627.1 BatD family protein [Psychroflexus montanilacus]
MLKKQKDKNPKPEKTGKMKQFAFLLVLLLSYSTFAQVSFTAEASRSKLGINERLKVEFKVDANGDNFRPPSFNGLRKIGGPNQFYSQHYENGKSTFTKTYTYFFEPEKRGKITIGQAEITVNGQVYKTSPIEIEVTAAVDTPNQSRAVAEAGSGIHLVAEVSKSKPYLNEGIYVVYKLFLSPTVNIRNWRPLDDPKFEGFWSQNINIDKLELKEGEFGGQPYRYVELRKTVLYPQKTGELKIEPLSLSVSVEVPTDRRDFFGRRMYDVVEKNFSANTRTVDVQSLPEEGKPAGFSGAVGEFDFKVSTNKKDLDAQTSLEITSEVNGKGNLKLFNLPKLQTPSSFEVYEPERSENVRTTSQGMRGSLSEKYTVIPEFKGDYVIQPTSFSYFNPRTKSYETLQSDPINIKVNSGPKRPEEDQVASSKDSGSPKNVISSKSNFNYINLKTNLMEKDETQFFQSPLYWTLFFLPFLCIPFMLIFGKVQNREIDQNQIQLKRANKLAKRYLSEAKKTIGDSKTFYESLERALHNYMKARLKIQTLDMQKDKIKEVLVSKGASEVTTKDFLKLLESCELARYTPTVTEDMQKDFEKAAKVISEIDKEV